MADQWQGNDTSWTDQAWQNQSRYGAQQGGYDYGRWQQQHVNQASNSNQQYYEPWRAQGDDSWDGQWNDRWEWGSWPWYNRSWNSWQEDSHQNHERSKHDSHGGTKSEDRRTSLPVSEETQWDPQRRDSVATDVLVEKTSDGAAPEEDEMPQSSQGGSLRSAKSREPKTGKDIIPSYDGATPVRDFRRRVALFEASTGIDKEYRAGKLVEQMSGLAWKCTETLDLSKLRSEGGVEYLLGHLQQELEPVEYIRVFETLHTFFKGFKRQRGESFITFDMNFRSQMQKLDEVGAGLSGIVKSWWFLETAALGQELRKQVITASGGSYQYERLREALMAIVPSVDKDNTDPSSTNASTTSQPLRPKFFRQKNVQINKVHMVDDDDEDPAELQPQEEDEELMPAEADPEELERQAQVLITQASKRRAQVEQARGFGKVETPEQRKQRIAALKAKMPCSACKANGRTTFGHWRSDPECPFFGKTDGKAGKSVFVVAHDAAELSSSDEGEVFMVNVSTVFGTNFAHGDQQQVDPFLALSDTCCARSVCGAAWMQDVMQEMWKRGQMFYVLPERQAFRFGAGPRIWSEFAVVLPTSLGPEGTAVYLRISVVPVEVPMLVSRQVLVDLGAIMDMPGAKISFQRLGTSVVLETTPSNHLGFRFWHEEAAALPEHPDLWEAMDMTENEVIICSARTEGFSQHAQNIPEPLEIVLGSHAYAADDFKVNAVGCSSQSAVSSAHSNQAVCGGHDDVGTEVESRVRFGHRDSLPCDQGRTAAPQCRQVEGDLGSGEATEESQHPAGGLEEVGFAVIEEPVRRVHHGHWLRGRRGQLLLELSMWEEDVRLTMDNKMNVADQDNNLMCEKCGIRMIICTNRVTKELFYGCIRFPECRVTYPLTVAGVETREDMKHPDDKKTARAGKPPRKRPTRPPQGSDASWIPVQESDSEDMELQPPELQRTHNANLSEEEMRAILQMRAKTKEKDTKNVTKGDN